MTLKEFRKSLSMNQKEFANELGISFPYYHRIERGYRNPSYGFMKKLKAKYPNINIDQMFFGD